ncbi:hypothetical protein J2W14_003302 [Pseudarthrobacter oxydans]|uniref:DUF4232 domain-containing protein n=1 Tax=Pseudarthrobacter oxydans TaxID=1671 RepID=UPI0027822241|nr:DUF4232 domain-containing protein [Pseudarthrobacter oxydans]MDP9983879.1 hypothetical protein [Pseudarthrobacter oxydans]
MGNGFGGTPRGAATAAAAAAAAAGIGWLISAALFAALSWFSVFPVSLTRLVVPETVAASSWHAVAPWPILIPALSVLTLLGMLLLLLRLLVSRPADRIDNRTAMMSVWLCVVLASFFTSVLWSAGSISAQWPPPRMAMVFDGAGPSLLAAGYWGIVWGWIPALVWIRVAAARSRNGDDGDNAVSGGGPDGLHLPRTAATGPQRPRARLGILLAATAVCGVLLVAAAPLSGAATRAAANAAQVRPAPSPSPTEQPVVYGSPTVGPLQQTPDPSWCSSEQVAISLGEPDAATGHRGMPIRLVNSGTVPCVLNAYPDVAFDDTGGWAMDILTVRGGSFMTTDPGPRAITVAPGAAAQAALGWNAMAGAGDTRVGAILVAPFSGAARTRLPADLDMISGGYVAVTGWSLVQPTG